LISITELNMADFRSTVCIVGAGLSGAVSARVLAERGFRVVVLEKRSHIAGNCYDFVNEHGIRVSLYGAHLFHTDSDRVWEFVNRFSEWSRWEHSVVASVDGKIVPVPPNITTVNMLFGESIASKEGMEAWLAAERLLPSREAVNGEEAAMERVGGRLYEKIFKHYTFKQWAKYPSELDASVLQRIPVRNDWDTRYFSDKHQALPSNGYTSFVATMLDHPLISVHTSVDFLRLVSRDSGDHELRDGLTSLRDAVRDRSVRVVFTGPIDSYFRDRNLPKLEYRSIEFQTRHLEMSGYFQTNSVVNHPSPESNVTRIIEYKHFLNQKSDFTTVVSETTTDCGEPYYPVPNPRNQDLYRKYQKMAELEENVHFLGRLASYKYFNMDEAVLNALEFWDGRLPALGAERG
jgi:UDP-galactopyranose mutase